MNTHDIAIIRAQPGDYSALARFHYRGARPATCVQTLAATDQLTGELVGVLTVSMPTLNGLWRRRAWPRLFSKPTKRHSKRAAAGRLNTNLRTISRVIVDPRYRALGVARRLVEAYLADPLTHCTEAIAAMGRWCPFFARAGMREVEMPVSQRDIRLAATLRTLGVAPWELMDIDRAASVVRGSRLLREQLFAWASYSRATRKYLCSIEEGDETFESLAVLSGASLTARPLVFVSG